MKKLAILSAICLMWNAGFSAPPDMPENTTTFVCSTLVAANATAYTNPVKLASVAYKVLKIGYKDTTIASQGSINAGNAVRVYMQHGFLVGRPFANYYQDTIWQTMGDTIGSGFLYNSAISTDSLICAVMDTAKTDLLQIGNPGDSLQVSKGYHVCVPDPSLLNRFKVTGASGIANKLKVYILGNVIQGVPVNTNR